jgi:hypothetical protein
VLNHVPPAPRQSFSVVNCEPPSEGLADGAPLGVDGADPVFELSVPVVPPVPVVPLGAPLGPVPVPVEVPVPVPVEPEGPEPVPDVPLGPDDPGPLDPAPLPDPVWAAASAGARPIATTRNAKSNFFMNSKPPVDLAPRYSLATSVPLSDCGR